MRNGGAKTIDLAVRIIAISLLGDQQTREPRLAAAAVTTWLLGTTRGVRCTDVSG